ncbi:phage major tail tube protein [Klebsiella pneumoniae]|uniref:phage major tail tube protein n=1 Tax=Klebsiella pneumoniae TaxID=573 RepID=UPI003F7ABC0C
MALPRKLKHLNIFNAGNSWMGIAESVTLPKFSRKLENYRGGGMPGSVGIDLGLDDGALDTEMTIGGTEALLFKQMGKATVDGVQMRFTGSIQRDDTGEVLYEVDVINMIEIVDGVDLMEEHRNAIGL